MRDMRMLHPDGEGSGGVEGASAGEPVVAEQLAAAQVLASDAVERYRRLVASQPELVPEMVSGNTPDEIDASAEAARQAYSEIARRVTEGYERQVSPGNPTRSSATAGVEHLRPEAKIALGLRGSR